MLTKFSSATLISVADYSVGIEESLGIKSAAVLEAIDPNFVYSIVHGIEGDVFNENVDHWSWENEILNKRADGLLMYETWKGKPNCIGHINNDPTTDHFGSVVDCYPLPQEKLVDMVLKTDRRRKDKYGNSIAEGVEGGYINKVSMGCLVQYSNCSYCFPDKTPITMSDFSVKNIEDIRVGDEVLDANGKLTKVTKLYRRLANENLQLLKSRLIDGEMLVTNEHPFLVKRRGKYEYVPAKYLTDDEVMHLPKPQLISDQEDFFKKFSLNHLTDEQKLSVFRLLGYYAAEGCIIRHQNKQPKGVIFTFNETETDFIDDTKNTLFMLFGKMPAIYHRPNQHSTVVHLYNSEAGRCMETWITGKSRDKQLNSSIVWADDCYIKEFMRGYIDGDGYSDMVLGTISTTSASKTLTNQCLYMLLRIGVSASQMNHRKQGGGPTGRERRFNLYGLSVGSYQILESGIVGLKCGKSSVTATAIKQPIDRFTDDGLYAKHRVVSIEEVTYEGFVYNFETESHSYIANNTAVHNCNSKATTPAQYCEHIRYMKGRELPVDEGMNYLKNAMVDRGPKGMMIKVGEDCHNSTGVEMSWVVNPAFPSCTAYNVLNPKPVDQWKMMSSAMKWSTNNYHKKAGLVIQKACSKGYLTEEEDQAIILLVRALRID